MGDLAEASSTSFARGVLARIGPVIAFAMGAMLIAAASQWRDPAVVGRWPMPQALFAGGLVTTLGLVAVLARRTPRAVAVVAASLLIAATLFAGILSYRAASLRAQVLLLPRERLQAAAGHVVAGFYTMDEARSLAQAGVAGLFLSPRNVRGRSVEAVAADVAALQTLRRDAGLRPLWIASDPPPCRRCAGMPACGPCGSPATRRAASWRPCRRRCRDRGPLQPSPRTKAP